LEIEIVPAIAARDRKKVSFIFFKRISRYLQVGTNE